MIGACNSKHFLVPPPGPGEISKGQISLNYTNKIQKLRVVLRIKDIKHIKRDFCPDA